MLVRVLRAMLTGPLRRDGISEEGKHAIMGGGESKEIRVW